MCIYVYICASLYGPSARPCPAAARALAWAGALSAWVFGWQAAWDAVSKRHWNDLHVQAEHL